jgi:hypothetical protein
VNYYDNFTLTPFSKCFLPWFVQQVRGSIPLFWEQPADWKLRPRVLLPAYNRSQGQGQGSGSNSNRFASIRSKSQKEEEKKEEEKGEIESLHQAALLTHLLHLALSYGQLLSPEVVLSASSRDSDEKSRAASCERAANRLSPPEKSARGLRGGLGGATQQQQQVVHPHIHIINLIDKKGIQGTLGSLLRKLVLKLKLSSSQRVSPFSRFSSSQTGDGKENAVAPAGGQQHASVVFSEGASKEALAVAVESHSKLSVAKAAEYKRNETSTDTASLKVYLSDLLTLFQIPESAGDRNNTTKRTGVTAARHTAASGTGEASRAAGGAAAGGVGEVPVGEVPVGEVPVGEVPVGEVPVATVPVHLTWFDFHHKCPDNNDAVRELFPILQAAISADGNGFFVTTDHDKLSQTASQKAVVHPSRVSAKASFSRFNDETNKLQRNVLRTNCMDCLDRTNVVQTAISRWVLQRQLAALRLPEERVSVGAMSTTSTKSAMKEKEKAMLSSLKLKATKQLAERFDAMQLPDPAVEGVLRRLWTENGDYLSLMYAGSR